ncbi:MAG: outer membrane lipoprotein carrier protein LolA [Planctomycetota bacterium]
MNTTFAGCLGLMLFGCAVAEAGDAPKAVERAEEATPEDAVIALLDRIEAQADQVNTLHAKLRYTTIQGLLGDQQVRYGELWYAAPGAFGQDDPANKALQAERLAVHFQREQLDDRPNRVVPADQWLVFDGTFFLERDEQDKQAVRREIRPPDHDLAAALPVPIRLDRDEAIRRFNITQVEQDKRPEDAPPGITLDFWPKAGVETEPMLITFDAQTLLPLEVRFGEEDGDLTMFRLVEPRVNPAGVEIDLFDTQLPDAPGWDNQFVPFGE